MKNLIKGEFYLLKKQKNKFLLVPLLMFVFFLGILFVYKLDIDYRNQARKEYINTFGIVSAERKLDECVLGLNIGPYSDKTCTKDYYSEDQVSLSKKRYPYNEEFSSNINRMFQSVYEEDARGYYTHRLKMLETAKAMENDNIPNAYYTVNQVNLPEKKQAVDFEITKIQTMLADDYKLQISPYKLNASNYLRVFLSNGGMVALLVIIMLFNQNIFIDENSLSVNNVIYTQTYTRTQINLSKIIVSIIYSLLSIVISLGLSFFIVGLVFGFGSIHFPLTVRESINSFTSSGLFTLISVGKQILYASIITFLLLIATLMIMHLVTVILQNSSPGLFLVYAMLGIRFILNNISSNIFKYYPFAYDNMQAVFTENYNYSFGVLALAAIIIITTFSLLYVGSRVDLKGGD